MVMSLGPNRRMQMYVWLPCRVYRGSVTETSKKDCRAAEPDRVDIYLCDGSMFRGC